MFESMAYIIKILVFAIFLSGTKIRARFPPHKVGKTWSNVDWNKMGRDRILKATLDFKAHKAKNVILFLGDGMGVSTIAASRAYKAQTKQSRLEDSYLAMEMMPFTGLSRTYSVDRLTSDSAATATAYLSGIKANTGTIGVNEYVQLGDCDNMTDDNMATSVAIHYARDGRSVGVVTTARVTHASPAGVYAHIPDRDWESEVHVDCQNVEDIAHQLVLDKDNQNIKVVLGGGSGKFVPDDVEIHGRKGERKDKMNLIEEWKAKREKSKNSYEVVYNSSQFDKVDPSKIDYLLGLFTYSHMSYESSRDKNEEPSLADLTEKAIKILSRDESGYFLFVEGARIDHAHHKNLAHRAILETLAFDEAIERALNLTNKDDTLLVVTADHSHVVTIGGYGSNTESVLGFADDRRNALDGKPYLQIQYANGPGYTVHRVDNGTEVARRNLTGQDTTGIDFVQDAGISLEDETHAGEDVAIFASGPMAHLLHSTEEQTFVAHLMMSASCIGEYRNDDHCRVINSAQPVSSSSIVTMSTVLLLIYWFR